MVIVVDVFPVVETPDTLAAKVTVSEVSAVVSLVGFIVIVPEVAPATIVMLLMKEYNQYSVLLYLQQP